MGGLGGGRDVATSHDARALLALAEASSEAMWRVDHVPVRQWAYLNPAGEDLLGVTLQDLQSDETAVLDDRVHPDDRVLTTWEASYPTGVALPAEIRWRQDDGTWLPLLVRFVLVTDDAGEVVGSVGLARPVSERARESALLRSALRREHAADRRLQDTDDLRNSFIRSVSHELRTPLTAVVGYAETLRHHGSDLPADRSRIVVDRLLRNANRLRAMLDDMLDVDRMSRGTLAIDTQVQDVAVVLLRALEAFQGLPGRLVVTVDPVVAPVDAPKLERVVDNLVSNALKYGGSEVTVTVRLFADGDWACLVIEDDGPGMSDELKSRVFTPFEQGTGAAAAASPGTGLGLALVRELVRLHDGTVAVEDAEPSGARFVVRLPRGDVPTAPGVVG